MTIRHTTLAVLAAAAWATPATVDVGAAPPPTLVFTASPATVDVSVDYETADAGSHGPLHPGQTRGATIAAGETVHWTITHRHPPGFIRARVVVTADRTGHGECLLTGVSVEQTARPYD